MRVQTTAEAAAPAPVPVEVVDDWRSRMLDRFNPIIVKEVRQGLRTRVFWIFFSLLLLACVVIAIAAYVSAREGEYEVMGPTFFTSFFGCLGVVHFIVLPYSAFRSLTREREEETWSLLALTGLGPRRILRGKLGSFLVQALLYGSAIAPFLMLSYFLNGIDLPTILLVMALGAAYHVFLTTTAICFAALGEHRVLRSMAHLAVLGGLLMATMSGLTFAGFLSHDGTRALVSDDLWIGLGVALWAMFSTGILAFEVAASRLSLLTESYMKGPRLAVLFQVVVSAGIWVYGWNHSGRDLEPTVIFAVLFNLYLAVTGLLLSTDVDGQALCHRGKKRIGWLLAPGAQRGYRFFLLLTVLCSAVAAAMVKLSHGSWRGADMPLVLIASPSYAILYVALTLLIARARGHGPLTTPVGTRVTFLLVLLVGCGLPPLIGELWKGEAGLRWLNALNPLVGMDNLLEHTRQPEDPVWLGVLVLCTVVAMIAADALLARRERVANRS